MRKLFMSLLVAVLVHGVFPEDTGPAKPSLDEFASRITFLNSLPASISSFYTKEAVVKVLYDAFPYVSEFFSSKTTIVVAIFQQTIAVMVSVKNYTPDNEVLLGIEPKVYPNVLSLSSAQSLFQYLNLWQLDCLKRIAGRDGALAGEVSQLPTTFNLFLTRADDSSLGLRAYRDTAQAMNVILIVPVSIRTKKDGDYVEIPFQGSEAAKQQWMYVIDPPISKLSGQKNASALAYDFFGVSY